MLVLENGQRRKQSNSLFKLELEDIEKENSELIMKHL